MTGQQEQAELAISPERYHEWFNESGDEQTFLGFDNSNIEENLEETQNPEERARIISLKDEILKDRMALPKIQLNRANRKTVELANEALKEVTATIGIGKDITNLNGVTYAAVTVVTRHCGVKLSTKKQTPHKQPAWKRKLEKDIEQMRREILILEEVSKGSRVKSGKVTKMKRKHKIREPADIPPVTEILKQKAKAQRIRRYEKRSKFFRQNKLFKTDTKKFYRQLGKEQKKVDKVPSANEIEDFWKKIWNNEKEYNKEAEWIRDMERASEMYPTQAWKDIQTEELSYALRRSSKWKSPGIDKVPNFWLHSFKSLHDDLATEYTKIVRQPEESPAWLVRGITFLLSKN